ncbi:hypothetical protein LZC95_40865 [Pendulispora brunnea]|uniref:Uncharacterized protein n=1 Tax=Pendulispora brunnea TaxID=2905690 RepID=A0ABZ2K2D4_9BACT
MSIVLSKWALRVAIGVGALALGAGEAHANGRFPAASQLVVFPRTPERLVLRTTFGILFSHDRGATWDWVCERAVGYGGQYDPAIGIVGDNVLAGTFEGLSVTQDLGCSWNFAGGGLKGQVVIDVTSRPGNPAGALALTSTYRLDDAGAGYTSDIYETTDEGSSWSRLGIGLPTYAIAETVDTAPSDGARIYASAFRRKGESIEGLFYASKDNGHTFSETLIELTLNEGAPFIAAVDPLNADRVYVRTTAGSASRLLVTDDGGKTFRTARTGPAILGFALSGDGSKVWVGGTDGLYEASRDDFALTKKSAAQIQCLTWFQGTLYACSTESSGFILGASTDDGVTFAPLLHLATVRGPLACASATPTANCIIEWPAIRDQLGIVDDAGPGRPDAGAQGATSSDDGGCSVPSGKSGPVAFFSMCAAAIAAILARTVIVRRRRPR